MTHGRGGKRPGAGRPKEGITKKVSLTLTQEEWAILEKEATYGAAVKKLIAESKKAKDGSDDEDSQPISTAQGTNWDQIIKSIDKKVLNKYGIKTDEFEHYTRIKSVKEEFLSSDQSIWSLISIIQNKKKKHLQWVLENQ